MYYNINSYRQNGYLRENAVKYALTYALNPNPSYRFLASHHDGGGDCSNFISQCLRAGAAPMVYNSAYPWWYQNNGVKNDAWSVSWAVAHSLYWTLKARGKRNLPGLKGIEVSDIDMLELGDLIQYENASGRVYHSTIITGFTTQKGSREPLISQHSFNASGIYYIKPAASKMHFIKIKI